VIQIFQITAASVIVYMTAWFIAAQIRGRNDIADVAWGLGFVLAAAVGKTLPEKNLPADGAALFAELCSSCHGTAGNGRGSRGGPSLQRPEFSYGKTPAAITQSIRDGRSGGMPAFGHVFTTQQLEALTLYILSLKK